MKWTESLRADAAMSWNSSHAIFILQKIDVYVFEHTQACIGHLVGSF